MTLYDADESELALDIYLRFGRYQVFQFIFCFFSITIFSLNTAAVELFYMTSPFFCDTDYMPNISNCSKLRKCVDIRFVSDKETYISRYNMVCADAYKIKLAVVAHFFGCGMGAVIYGYLADVKGRRWVCLFSGLNSFILSFIGAFSPNYWMFVICRCIAGFGFSGQGQAAIAYSLEITSSQSRVLTYSLCLLGFPCGSLILCIMYSCLPNQTVCDIVLSVTSFPCIAIFIYCYESPLWLLSVGEIEKARDIFEKIALINKNNMVIETTLLTKKCAAKDPDSSKGVLQSLTCAFREKPSIRRVAILMMTIIFLKSTINIASMQHRQFYPESVMRHTFHDGLFFLSFQLIFFPAIMNMFPLSLAIGVFSFLALSGVIHIILSFLIPISCKIGVIIGFSFRLLTAYAIMILVLYVLQLTPLTHRNTILGFSNCLEIAFTTIVSLSKHSDIILGSDFYILLVSIIIIILLFFAPQHKYQYYPDSFEELSLRLNDRFFYRDCLKKWRRWRTKADDPSD